MWNMTAAKTSGAIFAKRYWARSGHIINDTGLDKGVVAKYLGVLTDLH